MRPFFEEFNSKCREEFSSGAEIGVAGGDNAREIISGIKLKMLYLVDPYPIYNHETTAQGQKEKMNKVSAAFGMMSNVRILNKDSIHAADDVVNGSLDFVYIDANHSFPSVREDISSWLPKIKSGGMIGGHDFDSSEDTHGVYRAVCDWAIRNDKVVSFRQSDWWVWL